MAFKDKQSIIDYISKDPMFLKFYSKVHKKEKDGFIQISAEDLSRAEDYIGEKLVTALHLASGGYDPISVTEPEDFKINVANCLLESQTFVMSKDVITILKEINLPNHSIDMNVMPYKYIYVTIDGVLEFKYSNDVLNASSYLLIKDEEMNQLGIILIGQINWGERPFIGLSIVEDISNRQYEDLRNSAKFWVAMLTYIQNEKICSVQKRNLSYATSKKIKKHPPSHNIEVNVVSLPHMPARGASNKSSLQESAHHFNCRFTVRGHYRSQWYAKEKKHKLIWIDSQIRGPENAPFKPKVYKVTT